MTNIYYNNNYLLSGLLSTSNAFRFGVNSFCVYTLLSISDDFDMLLFNDDVDDDKGNDIDVDTNCFLISLFVDPNCVLRARLPPILITLN